MLTGVFYTLRAATAPMVESGRGGSVVITGSTSTFQGVAYNQRMLNPGQVGYGAAKHGVVAIMRNFAKALGQFNVRVNLVAPQGVRTTATGPFIKMITMITLELGCHGIEKALRHRGGAHDGTA
jgi:NAD(P)-dependent dehydrogenase (short-subunit alcohol dehydrogenase family)